MKVCSLARNKVQGFQMKLLIKIDLSSKLIQQEIFDELQDLEEELVQ